MGVIHRYPVIPIAKALDYLAKHYEVKYRPKIAAALGEFYANTARGIRAGAHGKS